MRPFRASFATGLLLAATVLLGGCAGYQLGSPGPRPEGPVFVPVVENDSFLPQSRALLTSAVREALARDGRLALAASEAEAALVVRVRLADYGREMTAARRDDAGLARKFALRLEAQVTVTDARTGATVVDRRLVRIAREVFTDDGQVPAEYQAAPVLAEALAREIAHVVLDRW